MDSGEGTSSSHALNLKNRGRSGEKNSNRGHDRFESRSGKDKNKSGKKLECWNCRSYRSPKKDANKNNTNAVTEEVQDASLLSIDNTIDSWVLNSGASFHTTTNRDLFENYVAGNYENIFLADGKRDVWLKMSNRSIWKIHKVKHVPRLKRNLISVGQLVDEGHTVNFSGGSWKANKGAMVVARGNKIGTLYMTSCFKDTLAAVDAGLDSSLWHCKLGHMSEKGMKILLSNGKLSELKSVKHNLCESVSLGNRERRAFQKAVENPKQQSWSWFTLMYEDQLS